MRTPIVVQRVWLPSYNQQKIKIVGARWCKKKRYTIKIGIKLHRYNLNIYEERLSVIFTNSIFATVVFKILNVYEPISITSLGLGKLRYS